jgi:hypothetical protein
MNGERQFTFATTSTNGYPIARFKQFVIDNGVMDLGLKNMIKAGSANLLSGLWSFQYCSFSFANCAKLDHD